MRFFETISNLSRWDQPFFLDPMKVCSSCKEFVDNKCKIGFSVINPDSFLCNEHIFRISRYFLIPNPFTNLNNRNQIRLRRKFAEEKDLTIYFKNNEVVLLDDVSNYKILENGFEIQGYKRNNEDIGIHYSVLKLVQESFSFKGISKIKIYQNGYIHEIKIKDFPNKNSFFNYLGECLKRVEIIL